MSSLTSASPSTGNGSASASLSTSTTSATTSTAPVGSSGFSFPSGRIRTTPSTFTQYSARRSCKRSEAGAPPPPARDPAPPPAPRHWRPAGRGTPRRRGPAAAPPSRPARPAPPRVTPAASPPHASGSCPLHPLCQPGNRVTCGYAELLAIFKIFYQNGLCVAFDVTDEYCIPGARPVRCLHGTLHAPLTEDHIGTDAGPPQPRHQPEHVPPGRVPQRHTVHLAAVRDVTGEALGLHRQHDPVQARSEPDAGQRRPADGLAQAVVTTA